MSLEKLTALRNLLDAETDKVSKLFYYKKINECLESIIKEKENLISLLHKISGLGVRPILYSVKNS